VFKITPSGTLTTLHEFCPTGIGCSDGAGPTGLLQATDGNFYGTTSDGGKACLPLKINHCGVVFKITPTGTYSVLYTFCQARPLQCLDGGEPFAGLSQSTDGYLYGTTTVGGLGSGGTVFSLSQNGTLAVLHSFALEEGYFPEGILVQGTDGGFYGTTRFGGSSSAGSVFSITTQGVFESSSFDVTNGVDAFAGLIQATDGNFYGTTSLGGDGIKCGNSEGCGTIFRFTPPDQITTIYSFCLRANCPDGRSPNSALVQGTDGNLYGTTSEGGSNNLGTAFVLKLDLPPFVKTLPSGGSVGTLVRILGTNLTEADSVTFNGTPASFTVISHSEITTSVPTGATTGRVQVTTPSGTLLSNLPFVVK